MSARERESRPTANRAASKSLAGDCFDSTTNLVAMRRRRDAALRLPPLASGKRDPQFDLPGGDAA